MDGATRLPHELAEPLRYLNPAWVWGPLGALGILALAMLAWWILRSFRASRRAQPASHPGSTGARPVRPGGLASQIETLKQRFLDRKRYREGCHALAELLRVQVGRRRRIVLATLTAREIRGRLGELSVTSLFELLAELQFRRAEPSRDDFTGICDLAADTARGKQ